MKIKKVFESNDLEDFVYNTFANIDLDFNVELIIKSNPSMGLISIVSDGDNNDLLLLNEVLLMIESVIDVGGSFISGAISFFRPTDNNFFIESSNDYKSLDEWAFSCVDIITKGYNMLVIVISLQYNQLLKNESHQSKDKFEDKLNIVRGIFDSLETESSFELDIDIKTLSEYISFNPDDESHVVMFNSFMDKDKDILNEIIIRIYGKWIDDYFEIILKSLDKIFEMTDLKFKECVVTGLFKGNKSSFHTKLYTILKNHDLSKIEYLKIELK